MRDCVDVPAWLAVVVILPVLLHVPSAEGDPELVWVAVSDVVPV